MAVRFIIGRAGSGKSRYVLDTIRQELLQRPQGDPLLLLVPEQATFQAEYALVTSEGLSGMMRAQAMSFRRMAFRVMQEVGGTTRTPIDDTGKMMFLYKILHKYKNELRLFHHTIEQTGFIANINELFNEFKRYSLTPAMFHTYCTKQQQKADTLSPILKDKLHDLALLYAAFETELRTSYIDAQEYLDILAEQLPDATFIRQAHIWVDGFYGFTPQEFHVLAQLMLYAKEVTITLCLDREYTSMEQLNECELFHPTARTFIQFQKLMREYGIQQLETVHLPEEDISPRFMTQPSLAHLEQHYDTRKPWKIATEMYEKSEFSADNIDGNKANSADNADENKANSADNIDGNKANSADNADDIRDISTDRANEVPAISIHAAVHRRAEIEGVTREMLRLVRDEGYRWRDMAVMVRDAAQYEDGLTASLSEHGIPYFFDQKRQVIDHPLIEFIRSALEVVQFNWQYDHVFRCVKTDFFLPLDEEEKVETDKTMIGHEPVDHNETMNMSESVDRSETVVNKRLMDELENYVLAFGIRGKRWTDSEPWSYRRLKSLDEDEANSERSGEELILLQQIHAARMAVVKPLLTFQNDMAKASNVEDRVLALYTLLENVQAAKRLERWSEEAIAAGQPEQARQHTQMWGMVMDAFDQIVEVIGEGELELEMFIGLLETGLESIKLGLVPPAIDQVLIGNVDRTRSTQVKFCFVLGVNDGVMPQKGLEDGILAEQEREHLIDSGLELAPGSRRRMMDEQFLIYTVLSTASEHLWLSYPLADEEGKALLPSEVIRRVKLMFPQLKTNMLFNDPLAVHDQKLQGDYVVHPERAMSYLIVQLRQWRQGVKIDPLWWEVYNWLCTHETHKHKLERMLYGLFYRNQEKPLSERTRRELYGQQLQASVSRMERYVSCPFSQFVSHGLRLQERQVYRLEAPDIGQLFHAALSRISQLLQQQNRQWGELTDTECKQLAIAAVDELAPRMQSEILLSTKRYHYIAHKLKRIIGRAAIVLGEHARRGAFVPVGIELSFGKNGTLPPLTFSLPNGVQMEIIGRIDRVDSAKDEQGVLLRVIDYKSSQTQLTLSDVYYGLSLQVLTYLDVVVTHAETWLGQKGIPAGVLYFHVHHPLLKVDNMPQQEEAERALFQQFKMRGLILAEQHVIKQMDSTLSSGNSDIIPVGLRKDGQPYAYSSVADRTEWQLLQRHVRQTIQEIGIGITDGHVDIRPFRKGQHVACTFCSYKPICQFDQQFEDNEYNFLPNMNKETVWEKMQKEGER